MSLLKKTVSFFMLAGAFASAGCVNDERPQQNDIPELTSRTLPIINGTRVTGRDHYSTVSIVVSYHGSSSYQSTCSGTLITPNYVLTAGHCISRCEGEKDDMSQYRPLMHVGFGQSENSLTDVYDIEAFYTHPQFYCSGGDYGFEIKNDIAILKLKKSVPLSVASPTLPLPPQYAITANDVDKGSGIQATTVGFGKTDYYDDDSGGSKYKITRKIYAVCPLGGGGSKRCSGYTGDKGFVFFDFSSGSGACHGDSGGPTFVTREGYEFVAGVSSWVHGKCDSYNAMTSVSDYYDFIVDKVSDLASGEPEDCFNGKDDNGDGRIDCNDPYCFVQKQCIPEDCFNKIDDNENGLVDCDDSACKKELKCQPEICNDGIDNNGNGLIDCNEGTCFVQLICKPEICDDGIDNNGDGKADCDDPKCQNETRCLKEDCFNGKDDNKNGLVDCYDPACFGEKRCQPEICNDKIDNNDNGIIDCNEASCVSSIYCQPEICNDKIDNNANGIIDCAEDSCKLSLFCQPEICDDGIDNNGDNVIDCDDPNCEEMCHESSGGCSATPSSHSTSSWWWLLLAALPFGLRRKKA